MAFLKIKPTALNGVQQNYSILNTKTYEIIKENMTLVIGELSMSVSTKP